MAYNDNPSYLLLAGGTMTGILTLSGNPVGVNDAANKAYVDAISAGLNFKTAAVCATTATLNALYVNGASGVGATLTNLGSLVAFTVDGITPTINQRVLVKNQTSSFQNGIYTITTLGTGAVAWILTRSTDYNVVADINPGDIVPVSTGSVQANTSWLQTSNVTTMGTSPITFQQYSSTPVQTTQYDVLVGGAANTIVSVGPGSAGQIFQSQGNATNPAYSTATYPAVGTSTGSLLRADGTNWSATTSTYPTSNAVSTLLYASSANVMSALATANNGVLITSGAGIPSIGTTLPTAVQGNITSTGNLGNQTNTTRCCFLAYVNPAITAVTGDGTAYAVIFSNSAFDQGSNFNTGSGTFTAPVTGKYLLSCGITIGSIGAGHTFGSVIIASSTTPTQVWESSPAAMATGGFVTLTGSCIVNLAANATVTITVTVTNSTKTIQVFGNGTNPYYSFFSGFLLC